jgi:ketosteroid isomerase-like protein
MGACLSSTIHQDALMGKYMRIWTREQDGSWKIYREMFNDSPL